LAGFDIDGALRWAKFDPGQTLARRRDADLPFAAEPAGAALLLDSCVYIDQMQGCAPRLVEAMVEARHVHHSTVAIQELVHAIGVLRPDDRRTASTVAAIRRQIEAMPDHRIVTPDADMLGRAALLAGMLCRLQGYARDAQLKALHDATLFLQAQKLGLTLLTANIAEFDLLLQLVPSGRVLFYRVEPAVAD